MSLIKNVLALLLVCGILSPSQCAPSQIDRGRFDPSRNLGRFRSAGERIDTSDLPFPIPTEFPSETDLACKNLCQTEITWDYPQYFCTSEGETRKNYFGIFAFVLGSCLIQQQAANYYPPGEPVFGISAAGKCGCPSDCSAPERGTCVENSQEFSSSSERACRCAAGWTGPDCATVECPANQCSGRGECFTFEDAAVAFSTCKCEAGYALNDCSAVMNDLPDVPLTLNHNQYTSWDQYGDKHPIFNQSTIAQIYLSIDPADLADLLLSMYVACADSMHILDVLFHDDISLVTLITDRNIF